MIKNGIILIVSALLLSGCTGEACIDADDFGHANFTVSARYKKSDFKANQPMGNQIAPWRNSHYVVNGRPLTVVVKNWDEKIDYNMPSDLSAWCAWYGNGRHDDKLSSICERLPECKFIDDQMCTSGSSARISNAPCIFKKGVGLYALIAKKGSDPNRSLNSQLDPSGISFHVGQPTSDYKIYDVNKKGKTVEVGGRVYNYSDEDKLKYADSKLYFKILDKFYNDNSGQYRVIVKSGITQDSPDPISYVIKLVKDFLFDNDYGLIRNIYLQVINQPGYRLAVSMMLTLYIMFTALSYLSGNLQITHTELIVRVIKIAIVSTLLSTEYSWSFFNDYLFVFFVGGVEQILQMIMEAGASGPGSSSILAMMLAPQTLAKVLSLLFVDGLGFIYIILFIIALFFVTMVFFQAAVIYLTALIIIGIIITTGPIFICFMLFGITRSLFENWLKQLISYSVQPIILFTGLVFISMILRQEIYGSLGFRVCKHSFPKLSKGSEKFVAGFTANVVDDGAPSSIFYWWFPEPMKGSKFSREKYPIPVPIDHFASDANTEGASSETGFCKAYGCIEDRYVDLPFLDPEKDQRRINHFWNGKFVQLDGMLLIFAVIYLLHQFNGLAVSIARFLTGTSGNFTDVTSVGNIAKQQGIEASRWALRNGGRLGGRLGWKLGGVLARNSLEGSLFRRASKTMVGRKIGEGAVAFGRKASEVTGVVVAGTLAAPGIAAAKVDSAMKMPAKRWNEAQMKSKIKELKKEALSKNADKNALKKVAISTGLKAKDLKPKAMANYRKMLSGELQQMEAGLTPKQADELALKMSKKKSSEVNDQLAEIKYKKKFSELSKDEKAFIEMINDKELRSMARHAEKTQKFQEAYANAYITMSNEGVGSITKSNYVMRKAGEVLYKETNLEAAKEMEGPAVQERIEQLSKNAGEKVTSIEFMMQQVKTPMFAEYKELAKKEIRNEARNRLDSFDPTPSKDSSKDSEMTQKIDNAHKIEKEMIEEKYRGLEERYEAANKASIEAIQQHYKDAYSILSKTTNMDGVTVEQMPQLLKRSVKTGWQNPLNVDQGKKWNQDVAIEKAKELEQALETFTQSQEMLQEIDNSKIEIAKEIDLQVEEINKSRKKSGMKKYQPEKEKIPVRPLHKIQDIVMNTIKGFISKD